MSQNTIELADGTIVATDAGTYNGKIANAEVVAIGKEEGGVIVVMDVTPPGTPGSNGPSVQGMAGGYPVTISQAPWKKQIVNSTTPVNIANATAYGGAKNLDTVDQTGNLQITDDADGSLMCNINDLHDYVDWDDDGIECAGLTITVSAFAAGSNGVLVRYR